MGAYLLKTRNTLGHEIVSGDGEYTYVPVPMAITGPRPSYYNYRFTQD